MGKYQFSYEEKITIIREHEENHKTLKAICEEYDISNLKTAPCRYSGSAYLNNLIICGHNYTSHFGNLKNLNEGDLATFTDMDGNVFTYKMVERETLPLTSIEAVESGDWDLTLFTVPWAGKAV